MSSNQDNQKTEKEQSKQKNNHIEKSKKFETRKKAENSPKRDIFDDDIENEEEEEDERQKKKRGSEMYPKTVFIKELPEDYTFTEIIPIIEKCTDGDPVELRRMEDGALLVRFEDGKYSQRLVGAATGKKGNKLKLRDHQLHVFPKRERGSQSLDNDGKFKGFHKMQKEKIIKHESSKHKPRDFRNNKK